MHADIERIIQHVIDSEGGYINHPSDKGGPTKYGITLATLREWRDDVSLTADDVKALNTHEAKQIYLTRYVFKPKFDRVLSISVAVAAELVDAGVLSGPSRPVQWLQTALNALNKRGSLYADITADGKLGPRTLDALSAYLKHRGKEGEAVLVRALNCLQGAFFLDISQSRPQNEDFVYGWLANRVGGNL